MPPDARPNRREPLRVSLLVLPDATVGSVTGMFDTLSCFPLLGTFDDAVPPEPPFAVELVAAVPRPRRRRRADSPSRCTARSPIRAGPTSRSCPRCIVADGIWSRGRYPELVAWLRARARGGSARLLGLLRRAADRRDRPALGPRRHDAPGVRRHLPEQLPGRSAPPRGDPGRDRRARGVRDGRRVRVLARPRPVPRRAPRRPDRGAGGREVPAPAVAHRRPGAVRAVRRRRATTATRSCSRRRSGCGRPTRSRHP